MGAIYVAIVYPVRLTRNANRASGEIERGNIVEEAEKRYRIMHKFIIARTRMLRRRLISVLFNETMCSNTYKYNTNVIKDALYRNNNYMLIINQFSILKYYNLRALYCIVA